MRPKGNGWQAVGKVGGFKRRSAGGKWEYWYPGDQPTRDGKLHREELKGYDMEIVSQHPERARDVAKRVKEGIDKAQDICKLNPPVCRGNMGISRSSMPQIMEVSIKEMLTGTESDKKKAKAAIEMGADPESDKSIKDLLLDKLKARGVAVTKKSVPAGRLKATQREIQADKTYGMADAYLRDKFDPADEEILISSDNHILDGHHRWAALVIAHPDRSMRVTQVDIPMREFLHESFNMPGVFRADLQGDIVSKDTPLDLNEKDNAKVKKSLAAALDEWDDLSKGRGKARSHKYKRRWKRGGKWHYEYDEPKAPGSKTEEGEEASSGGGSSEPDGKVYRVERRTWGPKGWTTHTEEEGDLVDGELVISRKPKPKVTLDPALMSTGKPAVSGTARSSDWHSTFDKVYAVVDFGKRGVRGADLGDSNKLKTFATRIAKKTGASEEAVHGLLKTYVAEIKDKYGTSRILERGVSHHIAYKIATHVHPESVKKSQEDTMLLEGTAVDLTGEDRLEKARAMEDGDLGMVSDGLVVMRGGKLVKARSHKYKSRKKVGGKWRYEYEDDRSGKQKTKASAEAISAEADSLADWLATNHRSLALDDESDRATLAAAAASKVGVPKVKLQGMIEEKLSSYALDDDDDLYNVARWMATLKLKKKGKRSAKNEDETAGAKTGSAAGPVSPMAAVGRLKTLGKMFASGGTFTNAEYNRVLRIGDNYGMETTTGFGQAGWSYIREFATERMYEGDFKQGLDAMAAEAANIISSKIPDARGVTAADVSAEADSMADWLATNHRSLALDDEGDRATLAAAVASKVGVSKEKLQGMIEEKLSSYALDDDDDLYNVARWLADLKLSKAQGPLGLLKSEMNTFVEPDTFQVGSVTYHKAPHTAYDINEQSRRTGLQKAMVTRDDFVTIEKSEDATSGPVRAGPDGRMVAPNFGLLTRKG